MEDICNYIPKKVKTGEIDYYHFVYEASYKRLNQPFFHSSYRMILPFKGECIYKVGGKEYHVAPGSLFFAFPKTSFELLGTSNFTYLYISFNGASVQKLLESFGITPSNCVFSGFEQLTEFWMNSIRRVNPSNANALTESVFLYTLSFIGSNDNHPEEVERFDGIIKYIEQNYTDPTLSIKKLADMYFYSEKYLSSLFKKNTGTKFTDYINTRRIKRAVILMEEKRHSISQVATRCGFSDPLYFSKVFKKIMGITPSEYSKRLKSNG